ncbi:NAD(P)/FAD-dependent oxidoreductase [Sneathiella marina]|uniref:Tryptophan 2-monooxygenase n=1 Tax=Sneathiella marina TaxID=2950108 RepID=A0ABY4W5S2_9PROT|nr:FAD-dependent oxidoreductase [Sneathiella marina]USG61232.1 NAD(P)/FAD-dependent oxidoreductase [Sneathiella marina]
MSDNKLNLDQNIPKKNQSNETISSEAATKEWRQPYPGPADRNFNFRKLLDNSPDGIGAAKDKENFNVAVIGMGAAGLTAAHELARSGLENIDMFEASGRYGGRLWTKTLADYHDAKQYTVMDFGAMRMPPFIPAQNEKYKAGTAQRQGQVWKQGNSVLAYLLERFAIRTSEFPNPGSKHCKSGIYYHEGTFQPVDSKLEKEKSSNKKVEHKDDQDDDDDEVKTTNKNKDYAKYNDEKSAKGQMLIWNKDEDLPPNKELQEVDKKWTVFSTRMKDYIKKYYDSEEWPEFWKNIVRNYYNKTFRQVVRMKFNDNHDDNLMGDFGGVGLSEEEARILFVIGCGDGGWGAFYNVSFLFVYRTLLHGYADDHQVIEGLFQYGGKLDLEQDAVNKKLFADKMDMDSNFKGDQRPGNHQINHVVDSLGNKFESPEYLGLGTFPDCLLFGRLFKDDNSTSLYDSKKPAKEDGVHLFLNSPVSKIERLQNGKIKLEVKPDVAKHKDYAFDREYDAVIITVPTHQFGMEIDVAGFDNDMWPYDLQSYLSQAYWIPCAKVYVELKAPYWESKDCTIPQMIASETFTRDTYGVKVNRGEIDKQTGVLLISYTWTRDATKLVSYSDQELINMCVKELDRMLANCSNIRPEDRIANYAQTTGVDSNGNPNYKGSVHHWERQKNYKGAARFYDQYGWNSTRVPMTYNQEKSANSGLYFAGEGYHADAGWVEPAFRSAIDAVLHLFNNNQIDIVTKDFEFKKDYARYELNFDPDSPSTELKQR